MIRKQNDDRATRLRAAMEANAADLFAYFLRRTLHHEDAADLLSETALTAWKRISAIPREPERARMWLFVTARHTLANHRRKASTVRKTADALVLEDVIAPSSTAAVDVAIDVRDAMLRLPEKLHEVVSLVHWEGLTINEAGRVLRIPVSTARSRYARAVASLRETLSEEEDDNLAVAASVRLPAPAATA
ncbi:RNA polymerase sigma factor [Rathayibacter sp. AY1F9]|uniref:RNA polymerase sigma factor n=1 Tax=Rathayibacter sp. AY1F9 TaxID=2080563 RepID=UPI001C662CB2|nr:sigma-70 family RNA polymerase sigma factor [Rathayibacter sp. AY1F9]